jgi:peptide/nickel transport system permease protein
MSRQIWTRLIAQRGARLSMLLLALLIVVCALAPLIAPQNPADPLGFDPAAANHAPALSWTYLLGADGRGRSVLALLIWGGRLTLAVGIGSALLAALLGLALGALAGHRGGIPAAAIGGATDLMQAIPPLLIAIVLFARLGALGVPLLIAIFAATGWVAAARISRGAVAVAGRSDYAEAARAAGVSEARLVIRHLLPATYAEVAAWTASAAAIYVALEAGLDFLGLGLGASAISWGTALVGAQDALAAGNWWWLVFGGMAPAIAALALAGLATGVARAVDPAAHVTPRSAVPRAREVADQADVDEDDAARAALTDSWHEAPVAPERAPGRLRRAAPAALIFGAIGAVAAGAAVKQSAHSPPDASALLSRAAGYAAQSSTPSYIASATYEADATLLPAAQIPWAAREPCPADLHATSCVHSDVQLWFSHGSARALVEGGSFVCAQGLTWAVNPMAGLARTARERCGALGPDLWGLGFTAGRIQALLPPLNAPRPRITGQGQVTGQRCWEIALPPDGRACIGETRGLTLRLERLDHAGLPVARFTITSIAFALALAPELFANPIPGGHGPLLSGLSQPLLTIQAADDFALFSALVPTMLPPGLTAETPTFDSFYNSAHGYALEQRVRQTYLDRRGRVALVLIETLPGSGWDATPVRAARRVTLAGRPMQVWPARGDDPAVVRVESVGTAALVSSGLLPLATLERVAAGLQ